MRSAEEVNFPLGDYKTARSSVKKKQCRLGRRRNNERGQTPKTTDRGGKRSGGKAERCADGKRERQCVAWIVNDLAADAAGAGLFRLYRVDSRLTHSPVV